MKIATHNGVFHADDVFAVAVLYLIGSPTALVRTRDPKLLAMADISIDVGGKYDTLSCDFDHHQIGGAGTRPNGIPYASFGLIWKRFGETACGSKEVADIVDRQLVQVVDAADCGYSLVEAKFPDVLPFNVSAVISSFNPNWDERSIDFDGQFKIAMTLAVSILGRVIAGAKSLLASAAVVRDALHARKDKRILVLQQPCPWQDIVVIEEPEVLYVLFPAETGDWRIQVVPMALGSFEARKSLPEAWAGKRDAELAALTGCEDAIFCHNACFIGGAKSKESVLKMAQLALAS